MKMQNVSLIFTEIKKIFGNWYLISDPIDDDDENAAVKVKDFERLDDQLNQLNQSTSAKTVELRFRHIGGGCHVVLGDESYGVIDIEPFENRVSEVLDIITRQNIGVELLKTELNTITKDVEMLESFYEHSISFFNTKPDLPTLSFDGNNAIKKNIALFPTRGLPLQISLIQDMVKYIQSEINVEKAELLYQINTLKPKKRALEEYKKKIDEMTLVES